MEVVSKLIQNFMRRFVFGILRVPASLEVSRRSRPDEGSAVVDCMDGFDYITRV